MMYGLKRVHLLESYYYVLETRLGARTFNCWESSLSCSASGCRCCSPYFLESSRQILATSVFEVSVCTA